VKAPLTSVKETWNMSKPTFNKYRAAVEILQKGRDVLVESMADEILGQGDELVEGGFLFNEFLESQGTRLHFLSLLVSQLEQSAETLDQRSTAPPQPPSPAPPPKAPLKRRPRPKKVQQKVPSEGSPDDV
jgi:hypothetical protein